MEKRRIWIDGGIGWMSWMDEVDGIGVRLPDKGELWMASLSTLIEVAVPIDNNGYSCPILSNSMIPSYNI